MEGGLYSVHSMQSRKPLTPGMAGELDRAALLVNLQIRVFWSSALSSTARKIHGSSMRLLQELGGRRPGLVPVCMWLSSLCLCFSCYVNGSRDPGPCQLLHVGCHQAFEHRGFGVDSSGISLQKTLGHPFLGPLWERVGAGAEAPARAWILWNCGTSGLTDKLSYPHGGWKVRGRNRYMEDAVGLQQQPKN